MLFEADPILRQIKQLGQLVQALAGASGAVPDNEDVEQALNDAYLGLLGLDVDFADSLSADALLRMLRDDGQRRALAELLVAHGDLRMREGDAAGAERRWRRAASVLLEAPDEELQAQVNARVG